MGKISNIFKKEKGGYSTISRIWSDPRPGAPSYYWTYVSFDCNIEGNIERITTRLGRFQCKKFVKKNFIGDTGYLVAKGDKLISWKPVSVEQPLSPKADIKVFLSYSQKWTQDAEYIAQFLKSYGLNVWLDKDRLDVGDKLNKEIKKEIKSSTYFVPLLSQDYFNSEWCVKEFELAAQSSGLSILAIKVSEKRIIMPPHFERIYKDILDEPIFLDTRKKDTISNIKRLAEYMREGTRSPMHRQNQTKIENVLSNSKIQNKISNVIAKDEPQSLTITKVDKNREYYEKRVSYIITIVKKRNKRRNSLQISATVIGLIVGVISWLVNKNNLNNEKVFTHIILPSVIVAIIAAILFLLPEYFIRKRDIKNEIKLSKLDRIALFDLRDLIKNNEELDDAIKKQTLKVVLKELKRSDL